MHIEKEIEENKKVKRILIIYLIWKHSTIIEFIMYFIGIFPYIYLGYTIIHFSDYLGEFVNIFQKEKQKLMMLNIIKQ